MPKADNHASRKYVALCIVLASPLVCLADQNDTKAVIHRIVRAAGSSEGMVKEIEIDPSERTPEVMQWVSQNRKSLEGTRGGPFGATKWYATTYSDRKISVHILDWEGKNNITLPELIIDRPIIKAYYFEEPALKIEGYPRVDQYPWGTQIVVPEEQRPNDIDTILVLQLDSDPGELVRPRVVDEDPIRGFLLRGASAKFNGDLRWNPAPDWIENWKGNGDSVTWKVRVPAAANYSLAMTYSCEGSCPGATFEILAGASKITGTLHETTGAFGANPKFEKRVLDGVLPLKKGFNQATLRVIGKNKNGETLRFYLYGLYLQTDKQKAEHAAAAERARKQRAPTDWFRSAKYGLMVHWISATQPRSGAQKPFCDAVRDFDVPRFADMLKEAGAAYLIFTMVHGIQKFPAPFKAVDAVLAGRTCPRDLPSDLADALARRGIKLILYFHHGVGDPEWSKASGFLSKDKSTFFENEAAILSEMGLRYGSRLAGWWFDDRYPLQPFEELYKAAKAGNPDRIVAWNSWILPRSTDFQEYWANEAGGALFPVPDQWYFEAGGPQSGLQLHVLIFLDDPWMHGYPNTEIQAPLFNDEVLADYIVDCNKKGAPVTMNIGVYQDGAVSSATVRQLQTIHKILRGN